jgi:TPR repeat protein
MLEKGRGVGQDLARAKQLFDSACKAGSGLACEHAKAIAGVDAGR